MESDNGTSEHPNQRAIELTNEKAVLSEEIGQVAQGDLRIMVEQDGRPIAAIISVEEFRRFQEAERTADRAALFDALTAFGEAFKDVPDDELERELALAQSEVRAAMRAEREAAQQ